MASVMRINLSGQTIPVDDVDKGRIGEIYNREVYCDCGHEGSMYRIAFLAPDGKITYATIQTASFPDGFDTPITDKHSNYYTMDDGKNYHIFDMRREEEVYMADGTRWGSVAAGARIACSDAVVGDTHPDWKQVEYVSSGNTWTRVEGHNSRYGFVDTGMAISSMPDLMSMYGTW